MNVPMPSAEALGIAYGLSEVVLGLVKRSGAGSAATDRSSLRLIWVVILASVAVAIVGRGLVPQAWSPLLARCYPLGVALFASGLALRWYAILHLGRYFTVDVAIAGDHRVVETGPYRFLRHPSYSGALLAFVGYGICLASWVSLAAVTVPIALAFLRRIEIEEAALVGALGDAYRAYARRTRRLIPFVY